MAENPRRSTPRRRRALIVLLLAGGLSASTILALPACNALLGIETGGYASDGAADSVAKDDAGTLPDGGPVPDECRDKDQFTDPKHCGGCNHDCLGGACVSGDCQPVTLYTGGAIRFVVSGDRIYFTSSSAIIRSVPVDYVDGGARQEYVGAGAEQPWQIAATSSFVFWRDERRDRIVRLSKDDHDASIVRNLPADPDGRIRGFAAEGDDLYFVDATTSTIYRLSASTGAVATYASSRDAGVENGATIEVALTPSRVFWNERVDLSADASREELASCARPDCAPETYLRRRVPQGLERILGIDTGGGNVFVAGTKLLDLSPLAVGPEDGGVIQRIVFASATSLSADATHVYFPPSLPIEGRSPNSIYRIQHDGGGLRTVAELQDGIEQVFVDERAIYWSRRGANGGLFKLAK